MDCFLIGVTKLDQSGQPFWSWTLEYFGHRYGLLRLTLSAALMAWSLFRWNSVDCIRGGSLGISWSCPCWAFGRGGPSPLPSFRFSISKIPEQIAQHCTLVGPKKKDNICFEQTRKYKKIVYHGAATTSRQRPTKSKPYLLHS